jgi:SAM-dependent methyltransferase
MTSQQKITRYTFDNDWHAERKRLSALEAWLDPGTIRHLEACGVGQGWQCLEVAAGGGSIAAWLCQRVGSGGQVVATDINPRFLERLDLPNLDVRRHHLLHDALPENTFDLVHARLILGHLPTGNQVVQHLLAALKPGGWILLEEMDFVSLTPTCSEERIVSLFEKLLAAHHQVLRSRGFDPFYGRHVFGHLRSHGLSELGTQGRASVCCGGSAEAIALRLSYEHIRKELLVPGDVTPQELDQVLALLDDPGFIFVSQLIMAVWGRRPICSPSHQETEMQTSSLTP